MAKGKARWLFFSLLGLVLIHTWSIPVEAQVTPVLPRISIGVESAENPEDIAISLQILVLLTILALAPAILIMMTSFTRIVVVLSFVRNALATQQMPPNQVLIGLALFLTFYVMAPTWQIINETALQPYLQGEITQMDALQRALEPTREFMFKNTREKDLELFVSLSGMPRPANPSEVPTHVLIPAFVISELKTAFQLGFVIFVPFLVIDLIVSSVLMSMGMLMLPPVMISLPFKILLFVMVDGWHLVIRSLLLSYR
ncbi:MAG TPA: flagellar type III secretion system pore protein FliP [Firmicutes bacterium]|nr:flagellar type III secretion system pore protein FliP [Bacillota bacterium]